MPAPPHMGGDVDVPTLRAQELQIGNGRFSAGQDYERSAGRDRLSWGNHGEPHGWLLRQRVEIVEIGNAGQHGYGYFNGAFHACVRFSNVTPFNTEKPSVGEGCCRCCTSLWYPFELKQQTFKSSSTVIAYKQ